MAEHVSSAFLRGPRLYLRPLQESDVDGAYPGWLNDAEVCGGNSHHVFPYTRAEALEYVRTVAGNRRDIVLAMVVAADDRHIGNISLARIDPVYRSAQLSILLGDRREWGKGFGLEAGRLLLGHGFAALNLARIECGTFSTNEGMRRLALALGMKEEGLRRQAAWKDGRYVDVIEYGILKAEFTTPLSEAGGQVSS
jgi:RimJ/RimL family protein N-acetyltransferase